MILGARPPRSPLPEQAQTLTSTRIAGRVRAQLLVQVSMPTPIRIPLLVPPLSLATAQSSASTQTLDQVLQLPLAQDRTPPPMPTLPQGQPPLLVEVQSHGSSRRSIPTQF